MLLHISLEINVVNVVTHSPSTDETVLIDTIIAYDTHNIVYIQHD